MGENCPSNAVLTGKKKHDNEMRPDAVVQQILACVPTSEGVAVLSVVVVEWLIIIVRGIERPT